MKAKRKRRFVGKPGSFRYNFLKILRELIFITTQEPKITEQFVHQSVLPEEVLFWLDCRQGLIYIDATAGGAGHSKEIAARICPDGKLIALDVDPVALETARENLAQYHDIVTILQTNYSNIPEILKNLNIKKITGGILFDLGASYYQLTSAKRGFSFLKESPLDMRFDPENPLTAYDVVNSYSEKKLVEIFQNYGEEKFSKRIAGKIIEERKKQPVKTTTQLANIVKSAVPYSKYKIHPATRVFQGLRLFVNNELDNFETTLKQVIPLLEKDARIVVISFHSLEDRLVKNIFKYYSLDKEDYPEQGHVYQRRQLEILTKKPVTASVDEIKRNRSSRSAKLRAAKKI